MKPEEAQPNVTYTDLSDISHIEHRHDHIVGNELRCSLHGQCPVILIKPTEVLEEVNGQLILVDKAPATSR